MRARDGRAEVLAGGDQQLAGALAERAALLEVVLVDARAAQVEPLAVEQQRAAAADLELLDAEASAGRRALRSPSRRRRRSGVERRAAPAATAAAARS